MTAFTWDEPMPRDEEDRAADAPQALYVIRNRYTGKYWEGGYCMENTPDTATKFKNSERGSVRLDSSEEWVKL